MPGNKPPSGGATRAAPANDPALTRFERDIQCLGGETRVHYERWSAAGETAARRAELQFAAAGHRGWTYTFDYADGKPTLARHRVTASSLAEGSEPDAAPTTTTALERVYRFEDGKLLDCSERRATGPSESIDARLAKATATGDCPRGLMIRVLAANAANVPDGELEWLHEACQRDPSSGLKLH